MRQVHAASVTRIGPFPKWPFPFETLDRSSWEAGDYVVGEVLPSSGLVEGVELTSGREVHPLVGDLVVGAFSRRFATLELTGTFEDIDSDGAMVCMTEGGCFGAVTSRSRFLSRGPMPLRYRGHVLRDGKKLTMPDLVPDAPAAPFDLPVVLLVGTSMSAGKTFSGRIAVRLLGDMGHRVVAAKLTGAGRWHDTLSFRDAGAEFTFDFMDAGLPTTVCPPEEYRARMSGLLGRIAGTGATVAVIEAGASPLEPYNGGTLVSMLGETVAFTILAASDPYAVVGIQTAWHRSVDLVTGPTANTLAGAALVRELTGLEAVDLLDHETHSAFRQRLETAIGTRDAG